MSKVSILIPTYNNMDYFYPCINSLIAHRATPGLFDIVAINNGNPFSVQETQQIKVIQAEKNLGWEGGLKLGLEKTDSEFVVFMNDDTYIPVSSASWVNRLLQHFVEPSIAAVGPSSNCVMGPQNIFSQIGGQPVFETSFLIGFCMMVRRSALMEVGGIDDSMPNHGDDIDLSIRFRKAGYHLLCDKYAFVYHHGFKTGQREFGSSWNSVEMTEKTNTHLIKKHGLKVFWDTITRPIVSFPEMNLEEDTEGQCIRQRVNGGSVLELGCGPQKTVPQAIGVDFVPRGEIIPDLVDKRSVADVVADIQKPLPFPDNSHDTIIARHILEHCVNTVDVLTHWKRVLKSGGRLIIAVPNQELRNTIPLDFQHVHAFTPDSLKSQMEQLGWVTEEMVDPKNQLSFVGIFRKNGS